MDMTVKIKAGTPEFERVRGAFLRGTPTFVDADGKRYKGRIVRFEPACDILHGAHARVDVQGATVTSDGALRQLLESKELSRKMAEHMMVNPWDGINFAGTVTGRLKQSGDDDVLTMEKVMEVARKFGMDGRGGDRFVLDEASIPKGVRVDVRAGPKMEIDLKEVERRIVDAVTVPSRQMGKSLDRALHLAAMYGAGTKTLARFADQYKGKFDMKTWQFKSLNPADIDFDDIASSLSRRNPIALVNGEVFTQVTRQRQKLNRSGDPVIVGRKVEVDGKVRKVKEPAMEDHTEYEATGQEAYVVVHSSIVLKADELNLTKPIADSGEHTYTRNGAAVYLVDVKHFPTWIKWVKYVKGASWTKAEGRRKATFEVTLPKV